MKDRIRMIMESTGMTQKTFAEYIGMSQAALSSIFNGRTKPTLNHIEAIRKKMPDISLEWLVTGEGEMFASSQKPKAQDIVEMNNVRVEQESSHDNLSNASTDRAKNGSEANSVDITLKKPAVSEVKILNKPSRRITEIRVFFDDRTYESFVPKE